MVVGGPLLVSIFSTLLYISLYFSIDHYTYTIHHLLFSLWQSQQLGSPAVLVRFVLLDFEFFL